MQAAEAASTLTSPRQIQTRWGIAVTLALFTILSSSGRSEWLGLTALALVDTIVSSLVALAAKRISPESGEEESPEHIRQVSNLYLTRTVLDLVILLLAAPLTGGIFSPILLILLVYLCQVSVRAGILAGTIAGGASLLAVLLIAYLQTQRLLPVSGLGVFSPVPSSTDSSFVPAVLFLFSLAISIRMSLEIANGIVERAALREQSIARSREELGKRVGELAAQREIGQQLAASLHLDTVLDTIGSSALRLVGANDVHLFLYDEVTGKFGKGIGVWANGERRLAVSSPRENGLSRAVVQAKAAVVINDRSEPYFAAPEAKTWQIESIAGFPIKKGERVLGVLNAAFITPHRFTQDECDALTAFAAQAALAIDNSSLYTQVEQHANDLAALYRMSLNLSQSVAPGPLMIQALASIEEIMDAPVSLISLVDESCAQLSLAAQRGLSAGLSEELRSRPLKTGEGLAGRVVETGEPVVVKSARAQSASERPDWSELGALTLAAVPLKAGDHVLGTLQVARPDAIEFTNGEVRLLSAIGQQVAVALEKARLYDEASRRAEELASLREIGLATTSTLELKGQLRQLYAQVQRILHPDSFFVGLYDDSRQCIDIQFAAEEGWELRGLVLPMDEGLSPWVIRMRRPLYVGDLEEERSNLPVKPRHETRPARSWLGVPLVSRDRVIGLMSVQSFRPNAYSPQDERFLTSAAQQVALAIENARLFETTEHRARELSLLNEISRTISSSLDLSEIYHRTVFGLADIFGYEHVSLYLLDGDRPILQAEMGRSNHREGAAATADGVLARVMRTGQSAFVRELAGEPGSSVAGLADEIAVPIRKDGRVVGILHVEERRPDALSDEDLHILATFSDQIAIAMANAQLYSQARSASA